MNLPVAELKQISREVLSAVASEMLLARVDATLDEGAKDADALVQACTRIEKMVNLFIGQDKAELIAGRFQETLKKSGVKAA